MKASEKSEARMLKSGGGVLLRALMLVSAVALGGEIKVSPGVKQVGVSIVRRVEVSYHLVTGRAPLEFDVTGPTWLRVYSRLWWPTGATGEQKYRLTLAQDDVQQSYEYRTPMSASSFGAQGHKVGEWRSFFVEVPAGINRYRLALDEAPSDTAAVRLVEQAPRPWQPVTPAAGRPLTLVEGRDTTRFRELTKTQPVRVELTGPCRVRIRCRLNFDPSLSGTQAMVVTVKEGKAELARRAMRVARAPAAAYQNEPGFVPSSERTIRFNLAEGRHDLVIGLSGTLAKAAAVAVDALAGEKYE